jgi:hypothetical protein
MFKLATIFMYLFLKNLGLDLRGPFFGGQVGITCMHDVTINLQKYYGKGLGLVGFRNLIAKHPTTTNNRLKWMYMHA